VGSRLTRWVDRQHLNVLVRRLLHGDFFRAKYLIRVVVAQRPVAGQGLLLSLAGAVQVAKVLADFGEVVAVLRVGRPGIQA
jgi:hypothetical protein